MKRALVAALALGGAMTLTSCLPDSTSGSPSVAAPAEQVTASPSAPESPAPVSAAQVRTSATPARAALLYPAAGGDGDSWKDRQGREYRMGLINTPEQGECYGSTATTTRKAMTANGFRASVYATDSYGRRVAVITTASGVNLNVYLARHGYANDRYLAEFRHENPTLATQLDAAFAAAKRERAGLWGACSASGIRGASSLVSGSTSSCHPDYTTCVPVKGDGSGRGEENDLDCGDIGRPVQLRQVGVDPYRLDADGNGVGCE
jgi:endonuclease YncB( thermonuclease family)